MPEITHHCPKTPFLIVGKSKTSEGEGLVGNRYRSLGYGNPVKDDAGNVCLNYSGTQIDLRDETSVVEKLAKNRQKPITLEHGEKLAKELKAGRFFAS